MTVLMFSSLVYFVSGEFLDLATEVKSCPQLYFLVHHHPDAELTIQGQPFLAFQHFWISVPPVCGVEVRDLGAPGVGGKGGRGEGGGRGAGVTWSFYARELIVFLLPAKCFTPNPP